MSAHDDYYMEHMAQDPKTVRFNDEDDPHRLDRWERALKKASADGGKVIRQLVNSYCAYVEQTGHNPPFPVELVPIQPTASVSSKIAKRK